MPFHRNGVGPAPPGRTNGMSQASWSFVHFSERLRIFSSLIDFPRYFFRFMAFWDIPTVFWLPGAFLGSSYVEQTCPRPKGGGLLLSPRRVCPSSCQSESEARVYACHKGFGKVVRRGWNGLARMAARPGGRPQALARVARPAGPPDQQGPGAGGTRAGLAQVAARAGPALAV
ncbi:hypothetical protein Taro_045566 [Colocasia esculenta]|uniref:Uncharacterized protein n=1 Tax=Colocasia esculenta TaxID=4460 RepID=A0A843X4E8_COLES|nr:hypothetical protein [Colocasia esculenta]